MSVGVKRAIGSGAVILLRTGKHPAAEELSLEGISFETFDEIYESAANFEEVYSRIADEVIGRSMAGDVVYCVPGHPLMGEEAVRLILQKARESGIETRILGSMSFIEASLEELGESIDQGLKIIDALSTQEIRPDTDVPNLFYQVYDRIIASELKLSLLEVYPDEFEVYLIIGAGTKDGKVEKLPLFELDRREYDYLTSVFVPQLR